MTSTNLLGILLILVAGAYALGLTKARTMARGLGGINQLESLPNYYGILVAAWCGVPALLVLLLWNVFERWFIESSLIAGLPQDIRSLPADQLDLFFDGVRNGAAGALTLTDPISIAAAERLNDLEAKSQWTKVATVLLLAVSVGLLILSRVQHQLNARARVERILRYGLLASSLVAILTSVGILFSVLFEAMRFFKEVPFTQFMFGSEWSPQTALRLDQVGSSGSFGAVPLFLGTLQISVVALAIAVPVGLMSAIYLSEYARPLTRTVVKPVLEMLAGIPTVVYGFFAALTMGPAIRSFAETEGLSAS